MHGNKVRQIAKRVVGSTERTTKIPVAGMQDCPLG
jgi:hypothetical protein